jgi:hypothetical protein
VPGEFPQFKRLIPVIEPGKNARNAGIFFLKRICIEISNVDFTSQIANNDGPLRDVARKLRSPVLEVIRQY